MVILGGGAVSYERGTSVRHGHGVQVRLNPETLNPKNYPLTLSHRMYLLISFTESTPPQNRQLNILISNSKQPVDDFVGELTF